MFRAKHEILGAKKKDGRSFFPLRRDIGEGEHRKEQKGESGDIEEEPAEDGRLRKWRREWSKGEAPRYLGGGGKYRWGTGRNAAREKQKDVREKRSVETGGRPADGKGSGEERKEHGKGGIREHRARSSKRSSKERPVEGERPEGRGSGEEEKPDRKEEK